MRLSRLLAAAGLVLGLSSLAEAATFYVDNSCGTGGNGSSATCGAPSGPFLTIAGGMGASGLAAGDSILVKATGTNYQLSATLDTGVAGSGSGPAYITVKPNGATKPTITRNASFLMLNVDEPYWKFEKLIFDGGTGTADIANVSDDHVEFSYCEFLNGGSGIVLNQDTAASGGAAADDVRIASNIFYHNGYGAKHSITTGRSGNVTTFSIRRLTVTGNSFDDGQQDYIQLYEPSGACRQVTTTGYISGNTFTRGTDQAENAIDVKSQAISTEPLVIDHNTFGGWNQTGTPSGKTLVIQHCPDYVHVEDNLIDADLWAADTATCAPCIGIDLSASTVDGGTGATGERVVGNTILNVKYALVFGDGTNDTTAGIEIFNNTIAKLRDGGTFMRVGAPVSGAVKNNLFDGTGNTSQILDCVSGTHDITGITALNNGWFGNSTQLASCSKDCNGDICDSSDTTGTNPRFYDPNGNDFRLCGYPSSKVSACINAGVNVGRAYAGSAPDLGYFESELGGADPVDCTEQP